MSNEIERVEIFTYPVHYVGGTYVMSKDRVITELSSTVVRITTRDGIVGYGECCPLGPAYLPAFSGGALAGAVEVAPSLVGIDATNVSAVNSAMDRALSGHEYAKSALDVACWDILGKSTGRSIASMLGGAIQKRLPLYRAISAGSTAEVVEAVQGFRERGFSRFQLKVGGRPLRDVATVTSVVEATTTDELVIADANGAWGLQGATLVARQVEALPRLILEQPCRSLEECFVIRKLTNLPFVLDEVIVDLRTLLRATGSGAMDGINLKINRIGGITKARLVRDVAQELGLTITVEETWGGDIATATVSQFAASTREESLLMVSYINDWTTGGHVAGHQPRSDGAMGAVADGPGLGIEVDPQTLGDPVATFT